MTVEHTPEPWRITDGDHGTPLIVSDAGPVVAFHQGDHQSEAWWEVEDADARLIASAPDLLAALQWWLYEFMPHHAPSFGDDKGFAATRAVIAKATGTRA